MIRKTTIMLIAVMLTLVISACSDNKPVQFTFDFSKGQDGWSGEFADLPVDYEEDIYELEFGYKDLPDELGLNQKAIMISGHNRSDDLFMFIKKQLTKNDGIKPDTEYIVYIKIEFATNAPAGAFGIGGPPGEALFVKVGASGIEPLPVIDDENSDYPYYRTNIDRGSQNDEGENAVLIGNAAKEDGSDDDYTYALKQLDNTGKELKVRSDEQGNVWIFVGTDSGFEGKTTLYYTNVEVRLEEVK